MRIGNLTIKFDDSKNKKTGAANKEQAAGLEAGYQEKYWKEYGGELETEKKVEEIGIEEIESGEVKVPPDLAKKMGLKEAVNEETPFEKALDFKIAGVSLTDDQITVGKKQPVNKSFRWLVEWFIMELLKAKYLVSWVKGKFRRTPTPANF
jgi:anti-sigma28 factor (negative regulator of flagellin synthesis)